MWEEQRAGLDHSRRNWQSMTTAVLTLLPVDLLVVHVLSHLELHDLARLDEAWPIARRQDLHSTYFANLPNFEAPRPYDRQQPLCQWLWKRSLRCSVIDIRGCSDFDICVLNEFADCINSLRLSCTNDKEAELVLEIAVSSVLNPKVKHVATPPTRIPCCGGHGLIWYIIGKFRHLESLDAHVEDPSWLAKLISSNPNLHTLTIHDVGDNEEGMYAKILRSPVARELLTLTIESGELTDRDLKDIAKSCPMLRELEFLACRSRRHQPDVKSISEEGLIILVESCPHLRRLKHSLKSETPALLRALCRCCHDLRCVDNRATLTGELLRIMAESCPALTEVQNAFWAVEHNCDVSVASKSIQRLRHLRLHCDEGMTSGRWGTLCYAAAHLSDLHVLQLTGLTDSNQCTALMCALADHCHALQTLHLEWVKGTQESDGVRENNVFPSLIALAITNAATLKTLILRGGGVDTAEQLLDVLHLLPQLTDLTYEGDVRLDDAFLGSLISCCPKLTCFPALDSSVTDATLMHLADKRRHLRQVDLTHCAGVTEAALTYLVTHCRGPLTFSPPHTVSFEAVHRVDAAGRAVRSPLVSLEVLYKSRWK